MKNRMGSNCVHGGHRGFSLRLMTASIVIVAVASGAALKPAATSSKEKMYEQMLSLAAQIQALRAEGPSAEAQVDRLAAQYQHFSGLMGGDDPAHLATAQAGHGGAAPAEGGVAGLIGIPPPGCVPVPTLYTNPTPVAIPTGPAVINSTIVVAGAGTVLGDLNVQTFITHTFNADLDITLKSPAGTVITLTTDNGGGNDNVFNGTVWADNSNPAGQVPYVTNNGLVTDHAYVNLVLASPLVPEEALGAFIGEDPNGVWTLTVSDDAAVDGGSLNSWAMMLTTINEPVLTPTLPIPSPDVPKAITDLATVASFPAVNGLPNYLCGIRVRTFITHTFAGDLDMTLRSPMGTVVTLTTDNGGSNDDVFNGTVWDDKADPGNEAPFAADAFAASNLVTDHLYSNLVVATPLVPEEALSAFIGENPNGDWTLTISDDALGDTGTLIAWALQIATCNCKPACRDTACPSDLNGSGTVNSVDLGFLLSDWSLPTGSEPGCQGSMPCCSDLNGDGAVNSLDLGILLGDWEFLPGGDPDCP